MSTGGASDTSTAAMVVGESTINALQKQLSDQEKSRVKDRQELVDKIASQKKEFDVELQELRKRNSQVSFVNTIVCQRYKGG